MVFLIDANLVAPFSVNSEKITIIISLNWCKYEEKHDVTTFRNAKFLNYHTEQNQGFQCDSLHRIKVEFIFIKLSPSSV